MLLSYEYTKKLPSCVKSETASPGAKRSAVEPCPHYHISFVRTQFHSCFLCNDSRDRAISIATGYGLHDREVGVRVPVKSRIVSSPHRPHSLWGLSSLLPYRYREGGDLSLWLQWPGSEADHSPTASAEIKITWICTSTPHVSLCCSAYLVKHGDNFTFTFTFSTMATALEGPLHWGQWFPNAV
jgi:hypothetical protein